MNYNATSKMLYPSLVWSKPMANTADPDNDNTLNVASNNTMLVFRKDEKDGKEEKFTFSNNFYVDDPFNSIFAGANYLLTGAATASALVYATIA